MDKELIELFSEISFPYRTLVPYSDKFTTTLNVFFYFGPLKDFEKKYLGTDSINPNTIELLFCISQDNFL